MTSTFWDGTQSFSGVEKAIIPHMKEDIQGLHMSPNTAIVVSNFIEIIANPHLYWIAPRKMKKYLIKRKPTNLVVLKGVIVVQYAPLVMALIYPCLDINYQIHYASYLNG